MNLFDTIAAHIPSMHGWASLEKANTLAAITLALRPRVACEVGIWGGRSLVPVALALKEIGAGVIIGIDPYSKEASAKNMTGANLEWWSKVDHEAMKQYFLQQVKKHALVDYVDFEHMTSDEYTPPAVIDQLHVDGSHSDQAVKDIQRYAANVRVGGIAVLDDITWDGGGVGRAIEEIQKLGFIELYRVQKPPTDDWCVMQRVSK